MKSNYDVVAVQIIQALDPVKKERNVGIMISHADGNPSEWVYKYLGLAASIVYKKGNNTAFEEQFMLGIQSFSQVDDALGKVIRQPGFEDFKIRYTVRFDDGTPAVRLYKK